MSTVLNLVIRFLQSFCGLFRYVLVGVSPDVDARHHAITRMRTTVQAISMTVPILLWAGTAFWVARTVFETDVGVASGVAAGCALTSWCIERTVLAAPPRLALFLVKAAMCVTMSFTGATLIDTGLFKPEIAAEMRTETVEGVKASFQPKIAAATLEVDHRKQVWEQAEQLAVCEARGCDGRRRGTGSVTRFLVGMASARRSEFLAAQAQRDLQIDAERQAIAALPSAEAMYRESGLIARVDALDRFLSSHPAARSAWQVLFGLLLCIESLVLTGRIICPTETVDDYAERVREQRAAVALKGLTDSIMGPAK